MIAWKEQEDTSCSKKRPALKVYARIAKQPFLKVIVRTNNRQWHMRG